MTDGHPHQLIIFGPPGTSKSYRARKEKAEALGAAEDAIISVTFHSEFSYGDFVSRLLPLTCDGKVNYQVHAGAFLRALVKAYVRWMASSDEESAEKVVLLIDEINRGNCAEIFGDIFQLLDREDDGWSSYSISVSELTLEALKQELRREAPDHDYDANNRINGLIKDRALRLPPNLHLIGTMNTGDESIFFMDSAFKRRWNFEFSPAGFAGVPQRQSEARIEGHPTATWSTLVTALNELIVQKCAAPNLDDKLIGPWFVKARNLHRLTVEACHPKPVSDLKSIAPTVGIMFAGANNSEHFEFVFSELLESCDKTTQSDLIALSKFDPAQPRTLAVIDFDAASKFYWSKARNRKIASGKMSIEDFVDQLASHPVAAHIAAGDIDGKLFLYLWDNVFERDKTPIAECLGIDWHSLRTFGQFVARRNDFIDALYKHFPTA